MNELNTIRSKLQPHLGWHGARTLFVAAFIIALFRVRTVNLSELAGAFPGLAKRESKYKRQQRFFRFFTLDYEVIAKLVVDWMNIPEPWVLAVDRTQWDVGNTTINILSCTSNNQSVKPLKFHVIERLTFSQALQKTDFVRHYLYVSSIIL